MDTIHNDRYDCIVIGTGAAGISAVLTLRALSRSFLWLGEGSLSPKIASAEKIANYPGLSAVSGRQMRDIFSAQVRDLGIEVCEKRATGVYAMGDYFAVQCDRETFESRTVILATGVETVKPISGEREFLGRGVSYCATCDGFLYKDKTVAVVCTDKSLEHEAEYLASLAKKTYLFPLYRNCTLKGENIQKVAGMPVAIAGNLRAERVVCQQGELSVDGVFMLKTSFSPAVLVGGLKMQDGHVGTTKKGETNLKGLFAAGDCTGRPYQYAKAVGEGNVCAHAVNEYLTGR